VSLANTAFNTKRCGQSADERPLAIDLFCGLGGWTEGLLAENFRVIGFDIERHDYGTGGYPAQLVLQDVMTIHGRQFKDAALIVASPPCQEFSYMAMPWSLAKEKRARILSDAAEQKRLTALFDACFRIQREACDAAGRFIPLIVENVRGAQEWVGRSRWNYGSYHLWGDVPALMPMVSQRRMKFPAHCGPKLWKDRDYSSMEAGFAAAFHQESHLKNPGFRFDGSGKSFQSESVHRQISKAWRDKHYDKTDKAQLGRDEIKQGGDWFNSDSGNSISRTTGSKSKARKAASAAIAKIPLPLSRYIAAHFKPQRVAA